MLRYGNLPQVFDQLDYAAKLLLLAYTICMQQTYFNASALTASKAFGG